MQRLQQFDLSIPLSVFSINSSQMLTDFKESINGKFLLKVHNLSMFDSESKINYGEKLLCIASEHLN